MNGEWKSVSLGVYHRINAFIIAWLQPSRDEKPSNLYWIRVHLSVGAFVTQLPSLTSAKPTLLILAYYVF